MIAHFFVEPNQKNYEPIERWDIVFSMFFFTPSQSVSPIRCISTEILHFCRLLISVIYQSVCNVLGSWSGLPSDPIRTSTILAVWQAYIDGNINETAYCIRSVNHFQEDNTRYHLIHFCLHPDLFSFAWVDADLPRRALKGREEAQTLLFVHFSSQSVEICFEWSSSPLSLCDMWDV